MSSLFLLKKQALTASLAVFGAAACSADGGAAPPEIPLDPSQSGLSPELAEPIVDSDPAEGIELGDIAVEITKTTSSSIELAWDPIPEASEVRVFVGPEPKGAADHMPLEIEVARLPGSATQLTVTELAANTNVFIRLAATTETAELWGIAHERTLGGPRAPLDTPLRSVHALAPHVLMLVLETRETEYEHAALQGAQGAAWQAGRWRVTRADGGEIPLRAVHRRSLPVGQPGYPVGYEKWGSDSIVDVDDHIFLVLDEEIGHRELLTVEHEGTSGASLHALVPFSDQYLETPLIKVNQVGYNPRATKRYAYLHAYLGDGGQLDLETLPKAARVVADAQNPLRPKRRVLDELPISPRAQNDAETDGAVQEVDLATLPPAEGVRYRLQVPKVGVSYPTAVSEEGAFRAFYVTARGLYLNRWCGDLDESYTEWSRGPDHCSAYFVEGRSYLEGLFPESTPQRNERPVLGGHHDAGDFDIRPFHVVVAQYLMRAFEANRAAFTDGQLDLPESGNEIPDLLDEALYSIKGWEDLQNEDGSVRAGVESSHHPRGYYYADEDELPYWTFDPEPWHTAYVAALFAQASYLVAPYDSDRSRDLLERARRAYEWAQSNDAPPEFLLYAASELSRATTEAPYFDDFESIWSSLGGRQIGQRLKTWAHIYPGAFGQGAPVLADYMMGYVQTSGADGEAIRTLEELLEDRAANSARRFLDSEHALRNGRPAASLPDWGNSVTTAQHADTIYQALTATSPTAGAEQGYFDALSLAADYVLGGNPGGMVYITGLGSVSPQEPLHTDSLAFIKDQGMPPMPGIPVYGPVSKLPSSPWYAPLKAAFYPAFEEQPLGQRHVDSRTSVNTGEFTVWESQAPLAALFATLAPPFEPPRSWAAGGSEHRSTLPRHRAD